LWREDRRALATAAAEAAARDVENETKKQPRISLKRPRKHTE